MNPSNFGISVTLLLFPWVGIAPPYHFTENLSGIGDWLLPGLIVVSGTFLNFRFTHRLPLVAAWLTAFMTQALVRSLLSDSALTSTFVAALVPMSGMAFVLYTFYMLTDPATTPDTTRGQVLFGTAVAVVYGLLVSMHIVFSLFFALSIVSASRAVAKLTVPWLVQRRSQATQTGRSPASVLAERA
jgi:Na+-translocating ferredoxin:NAD+ oxidoreductase RnfD subunit